jgi:hypothetical protein
MPGPTPPFAQVNRSYTAQQTIIQSDWLNWINYVVNHPSIISSGAVNVQPALVSGVNIKTINGNNILGAGDLALGAGGGGLTGPAGANTQVQFNDGGALAGAAGLQWNKAGNYLVNPLGNIVAVHLFASNVNELAMHSSGAGAGKVSLQSNGADASVDIEIIPLNGAIILNGGVKTRSAGVGQTTSVVTSGGTLHFTDGILTSVT